MKTYGLFSQLRSEGRDNEASAWFRRELRFSTRRIEDHGNVPVLRVAYTDADPNRAQKVARDVVGRVIDENLRVHWAAGADPNVTNQDDPRWKGTKLELIALPNRPDKSNRWASAPWTIGSGELAGLGFGLVAAVLQAGWQRWCA